MQQSMLEPHQASAPQHRLPAHVISQSAADWQQITLPGVNLCLWQRPAQTAVAQELSSLCAADLPDVRRVTSLAAFDEAICLLLGKQGLEAQSFIHWRKDLKQLAALYFAASGTKTANIRLETSADDGCRRFHVDHNHLRLLCTYRGPGTEWLRNEQVDRQALIDGAPNDAVIRNGQALQFETFWAGILKGEAFPGNTGRGLVHRSPQIAGSGQIRVVFCLDY